MSRPGSTSVKPVHSWRIEPVQRPEPDLRRLAQLLAAMAVDRAKQDSPRRHSTRTKPSAAS